LAEEPLIAVFVDYENLALGVRDMKGTEKDFEFDLILKRLLEKGRLVFKRAYCDWSRFRGAVRDLHRSGVELVDIPQTGMSGKNSADIHMVVDAIDLCYAKQHIDVFALITGDSDFSPLAGKLKENDKRVLGCGVKASTSPLLVSNCDEFMYYDDLVRARPKVKAPSKGSATPADKKDEAMDQLLAIVGSLAQDYDVLWGSMVKQALRRVNPSFSESYYGYRNFAELLDDAADRGLVDLELDEARGNYQVRLQAEPKAKPKPRSRRRSS
jgi:uncharacterized protein (TIGR00288 family)